MVAYSLLDAVFDKKISLSRKFLTECFMDQSLVQREREITTGVLRHLQEIERRKLYCDVVDPHGLKYGSLFDYAVGELGYSEAAAGRRIQAVKLMTEIPEVEAKIESGALNLSNICQARAKTSSRGTEDSPVGRK